MMTEVFQNLRKNANPNARQLEETSAKHSTITFLKTSVKEIFKDSEKKDILDIEKQR